MFCCIEYNNIVSLFKTNVSNMIKSSIAQAIEGNSRLVFKPQSEFYATVKINPKRWALIYKGKKEATQSELENISNYFAIPVQSFFQIKSPELLK